MYTSTLLSRYPLISDQVSRDELTVILSALESLLQAKVEGDVVEFGCYQGTTSLFLQRLLTAKGGARRLFVYDSFQGLPPKHDEDESPAGTQFKAGELFATKAQFILHFKKAHLPLPVIKKAWFETLTAQDLPEKVAFAFLDGDYYQSIKQPLSLLEGRLSDGAVIIVDDYLNEALPGAAKAVGEWLLRHPEYQLSATASLAVLRPRR